MRLTQQEIDMSYYFDVYDGTEVKIYIAGRDNILYRSKTKSIESDWEECGTKRRDKSIEKLDLGNGVIISEPLADQNFIALSTKQMQEKFIWLKEYPNWSSDISHVSEVLNRIETNERYLFVFVDSSRNYYFRRK